MEEKICSKCGKLFPIDMFGIDRRRINKPSYRRSYCRKCDHLIKDKEKKRIRERRLYRENVYYRLCKTIRSFNRRVVLYLNGEVKNKPHSKEVLGCTIPEFKEHIESKFEEGMNWKNHGEWHIDHIIPLRSAVKEEDIMILNNYMNLQPLWATDNLKKGCYMDEEKTPLYNHLQEAYENFDKLREKLEFRGLGQEFDLLDNGLKTLNKYLKVLEKFDRGRPIK